MSRTNDPKNFFQTDSALNETARKAAKSKNTKGGPIKLSSKLLAAAVDPQHGATQIYVAEAAGCVKRIMLETGETIKTYSGPIAPLTSLAISPTSDTLFAGCWDKTIWTWSISTGKPSRRLQGHSDFVKTLLLITLRDGKEMLVSGSADATIIVWDAASGAQLHKLKGHTRGVLTLALDDLSHDPRTADTAVVFSAGSDREIRRWEIGLAHAAELTDDDPSSSSSPIIRHETNIDALFFDSDGDLWTASADRTAKALSRARKWDEDSSFEHPDYVRDVVVDDEGGWVVTACRDEHVRVWDRASGKLHHVFEGHYEEVTGLLLLEGQKVVSVSIDGSVRQWSLKPRDLQEAIKIAEEESKGKVAETTKKEGLMTEEEEAELAALLEEDE
ncbi:WD40 repeat-like protein [Periconia macrospinosa]|uniref:WD40 repeat-like protein n=1 Tax=Periconia macrospinosa TaxID=97972 RepID=A0A2V1E055_9PLEO|nr:WD40 repeat-like protein [Periconia macrospinosa]